MAKGLAAAGLALCLHGQASAGDIASFQPIGFSSDGTVFAFEQFGIQDGSGFPYSEIFAIDTVKDSFLKGTPVRVRIDEDGARLSAARAESRKKAGAVLALDELLDNPGQLVAFNPLSEMETDGRFIRYLPYVADPAFGEPYALALEEIPQPPAGICKDVVEEVKGFRLVLRQRNGEAAGGIVHEDKAVPASRRCATGYRLVGVMTYVPSSGENLHVALVMVLSFGFEGRDGRWIAVPLRP